MTRPTLALIPTLIMALGLLYSGVAPAAVEGSDLSGTYHYQGLACLDSSGNVTLIGTISGYSGTLTIQGNSSADTSVGSGCSVTLNATTVFKNDGTFSTSTSTASVPGGSCTISGTSTYTAQDGTTTQAPFSQTYTDGATFQATTGDYYVSSDGTGLLISPGFLDARLNQDCYFVYHKN